MTKTEGKTNGKAQYTRKFENLTGAEYGRIYIWLSELGDVRSSSGYDYITFGNSEEHARVDPKKRTIELTDKVEVDVGRLLELVIRKSK